MALAESGPQEVGRVLASSPWRLEHFGAQITKTLGV